MKTICKHAYPSDLCGTCNPPAKENAEARRSAVPCSAGWLPPEAAPHDGTPILGDFGWPWANFAVWDECDEEWCIATIQASPIIDRPMNTWIETDTEKRGALKRWMPLPSLPNVQGDGSPSQNSNEETK